MLECDVAGDSAPVHAVHAPCAQISHHSQGHSQGQGRSSHASARLEAIHILEGSPVDSHVVKKMQRFILWKALKICQHLQAWCCMKVYQVCKIRGPVRLGITLSLTFVQEQWNLSQNTSPRRGSLLTEHRQRRPSHCQSPSLCPSPHVTQPPLHLPPLPKLFPLMMTMIPQPRRHSRCLLISTLQFLLRILNILAR